MNSLKRTARVAGIQYLVMAITGGIGMLYIPTQIIVSDSAAKTVYNILTHDMLYRIGIVCQLICQVMFVYLVLTLNRLLKSIDEKYAKQMVALVIVSVPIAFLNVLNQIATLVILSGDDYLKTIGDNQLNTLVMLFFRIYEQGVNIVQVFWGLWLIPFGLLVHKSGFIPRVFGVLLIIGGIGYVVASCTTLLFPQYAATINPIVTIPSGVGEFAIILWLLIKGVRNTSSIAKS